MQQAKRATRARGFTLIELMIVVAVIGIIAAIAVPNYLKFSCRAYQAEAKGNGNLIIKMIQNHTEDLRFSTGTTARPNGPIFSMNCAGAVTGDNFLGLGVKGRARRYSYLLTKTGATAWTLEITGCSGTSVELDAFTADNAAPALSHDANACN